MIDAAPQFPPLFQGLAVEPGIDPFAKACAKGAMGCDAGLVVHRLAADRMSAAVVLAPEVPLEEAVAMLPLSGVAFQNALGALAPPEVAVHLEWTGGIRVNGARCGDLRIAAGTGDPDAQPEWLVVGLDLPLWPEDLDRTGDTPDQTALYAEGCADVDAIALLESWVRHLLLWISRWEEAGAKPIHAEWRGLAHGMGEDMSIDGRSGTFLGVDERFGLLLRDAETTHLIPLSTRLETMT
ncbi:Biotin-(acetyl-CoA carboxylase) ligase [Poseidonocella pacifica]|uniref:Biotin-(Acetyl-CoA carboxylase) ligase n=1 Tax=Poseidonocella pacifica TaxID=871651 RepID=A0A1I0WRD5_9RHOB|nr:biotin/lipoate--protein ligase family protein [Poseidonocella pacifica]SFA91319.1 Biotin-(acetyl-CoA carboxylase) ligase [Poseidonocella pacifica]